MINYFKKLQLFLALMILMMNQMSTAIADSNNKIYNAKTITLPNAMQVVVVESNRTPAVTHMVWYRIGSADEHIGQSGLAHYLEHLMFKGTDLVPSGEFSKKVKSWGGNDNAFTSWDFTAYFQTVPKDKLESVMRMEADRMQHLNFSDEDALTERDVVIEERKQRTDSDPSAQLSESMRAALFVNHPYARPIIGWDHEIEELNPQMARAFYNDYYAPRNAILVVSGDVEAKDVFEKAALIYGDIENKEAKQRVKWPEVPHIYGHSKIEHQHASVRQPLYRKLYRLPSAIENYNQALTFALIENIIGSHTGPLYEDLVVDQKIAASVNMRYGGTSADDSTLTIGITPIDSGSIDRIEQAVNDVLVRIADQGLPEEDLKKAITRIQDESVYERDSLQGPAMMVGYQLVSGLELDKVETWPEDLATITVVDIQNAIKDYLIPSGQYHHAVTGLLLPKGNE